MENQSAVAVKTQVAAPSSVAIVSASGKTVGHRFTFAGGKSAKDVKADCLKAHPGLKGKKLSAAVNAVLTGEKDAREQFDVLFLQYAHQSGYVGNFGELRKGTGALKLVKLAVGPVVPVKEYAASLSEAEKIELRKLLGV